MSRIFDSETLPWETRERGVRIAIVGDLMLDEYLDGVVSRISPEAPVPVHLVTKTSVTAGGAANVARNIQLVGGTAHLVGVWGADHAARQLADILAQDGVDSSCVVTDDERPTVKKTRITSSNHQLVRIDWEKVHPLSEGVQRELLARLGELEVDALLVSDYGKGCLTAGFLKELIAYGKARGIPVVVDPKGKDYTGYRGATLITPNRKEACEALGLDATEAWDRAELARRLQKKYGLAGVMVTLGAEGMYCLPDGGDAESGIYLPAITREVFDVSGAGDTVVAVMALALGSGVDLERAMRLANLAAGRVVEKWGTQPILKEELKQAIREDLSKGHSSWLSTQAKIVERSSLGSLLGPKERRAKRVVFTNGCFDILHAGHVAYLEEARSRGDLLVVGVNTDASVVRLKGPSRPIIPAEQRLQLLAALSCIDYVVPFDDDTPLALIRDIMPDVLCKGADYELKDIVGADVVMAAGGTVERIAFVEGWSTSKIIERIKNS